MTVDNVWLDGVRREDGDFEWSDGLDIIFYTNWGRGSPSNYTEKNCIQLTSYLATNLLKEDQGYWTDVSCARKNSVVCQKLQKFEFNDLQKIVLEEREQRRELQKALMQVAEKLQQRNYPYLSYHMMALRNSPETVNII
jgi:hypothetical protein